LETAEAKMGIPAILDFADLAAGKCNDKQLQLYLSLMYNAYKEKDLGMTKESMMKRVAELEAKLQLLMDENASLKQSIEQALLNQSNLSESLDLKSEEHSKVRKSKDDLTSKFNFLEDQYEKDRLRWEEELALLKAQKAKLSESSDAETTRLQQKWEEVSAQRDAIRDELRKTKDELTKEREVLEAEHKKLLAKLERAKKTKEGLEAVLKGSEASHQKVGPVLTKSIIQHANDMNNWIPILESGREYKNKPVTVPSVSAVLSKDYDQQLEVLSQLVNAQNKDLDKLLLDRTNEAKEVVSVAMGKLKKRVRTAKELEDGGESSEDEPVIEPQQTQEEDKSKKSKKSKK